MKQYNLLIILLLLVITTSCDDFLSKPPSTSDSINPQTTKELGFLLNRYNDYYSEKNSDIIFGSDDFGLLTDLYNSLPSIYDLQVAHYATWDVKYLPTQDGNPYFPDEWKKIFRANFILKKLSDVTGSDQEKASLKAEAHFVRAYSYFQLVNTYCLPYTPNGDMSKKLGLTIKKITSFKELINRANLKDTWDFILADLHEALKLNKELIKTSAGYKTWRASTPAVNAFAARVYLMMDKYPDALHYAKIALAKHSDLIDYNTDMHFSNTINQSPDKDGNLVDIKYPYTNDDRGATDLRLQWKELYYFRFLTNDYGNTYPSDELLNLYNHKYDLRYKYHMVENYSYTAGAKLSRPAYIFFKNAIPSGPTTAEMLLIEAECQARQGNVSEAMTTVNELRVKRMDSNAPKDIINLSALNKDDAIKQILEERRRELPFTQRFFDIRRYNNNNYDKDDVTITRNFYPVEENVIDKSAGVQTIKLSKGDDRFARPLPTTDINSSKGDLEQNPYK